MKKTVFITGSSSGLGFEIGLLLLAKNHFVIFNGRDKAKFEQMMPKFYAKENYAFLEQDFLAIDAMGHVEKFFITNDCFPNIVIHALGGKVVSDEHPIKLDVLHRSQKLNCEVAIELNTLLMPKMEQNGTGHIVHIGSLAGINANAAPCYSIAKAALHAYIKNVARFYASKGIIIFGIVPGIMEHEGSEWANKKISEPKRYELKKENTILKRFAKPSEIACYIDALLEVANPLISGSLIEFANE